MRTAVLPLLVLAACAGPPVPPTDMRFTGLSLDEARDRVVARCIAHPGAELADTSRNQVVCVRRTTGAALGVVSGLTGAAGARNALVVTLVPSGGQVRAQGRIYFETESAFGRVDRSERTDSDTAQFVTRFLIEAGADLVPPLNRAVFQQTRPHQRVVATH